MAESSSDNALGQSVVRGGRALLIRQVIGLVLSAGGLLVVLRTIGPASYGTYSAAFSIAFVSQGVAELSLDVYLVRLRHSSEVAYHQVFTILLLFGAVATAILLISVPLVGAFVHLPNFEHVATAMFLSVPLLQLQQVPLSKLEHELAYVKVGVAESFAAVAFPLLAVPLALLGAGVWAAVAGWFAQQIVLLVLVWRFASYRPSLVWNRAAIAEALSFGVPSATSSLAYSLRNLANPLLVGHLIGASAVGVVSVVLRILDQLALGKQVTFRIAISVLAKLRHDPPRLRSAVAQGMLVQVVIVGVPVVAFSALGRFIVPVVFGEQWHGVVALFPVLAPAYLVYVVFSVELAAMSGQPRPWVLVLCNGTNTLLLWLGVLVFVPRYGLLGYGYAELGSVLSYLLTAIVFARTEGKVDLGMPVLWLAALGAASSAPATSVWLFSAVGLILVFPASRRRLGRLGALALSGGSLGKHRK